MEHKPALVRRIEAELARAGKRYRIDWNQLDEPSLREVVRLLRDIEHDKLVAANNARRGHWRMGVPWSPPSRRT
jgi:hypothetical protein